MRSGRRSAAEAVAIKPPELRHTKAGAAHAARRARRARVIAVSARRKPLNTGRSSFAGALNRRSTRFTPASRPRLGDSERGLNLLAGHTLGHGRRYAGDMALDHCAGQCGDLRRADLTERRPANLALAPAPA